MPTHKTPRSRRAEQRCTAKACSRTETGQRTTIPRMLGWRDRSRYIVALIVGLLFWIFGTTETASMIGVVIVVITVLAFAWHRSIAAQNASDSDSE